MLNHKKHYQENVEQETMKESDRGSRNSRASNNVIYHAKTKKEKQSTVILT